jgi:hypothetical protein
MCPKFDNLPRIFLDICLLRSSLAMLGELDLAIHYVRSFLFTQLNRQAVHVSLGISFDICCGLT